MKHQLKQKIERIKEILCEIAFTGYDDVIYNPTFNSEKIYTQFFSSSNKNVISKQVSIKGDIYSPYTGELESIVKWATITYKLFQNDNEEYELTLYIRSPKNIQ